MADHYEAALGHRAAAIETRDQLRAIHDKSAIVSKAAIASKYDLLRNSLKLAEIDALLAIAQIGRDLVNAIEIRR